MNANQILANSDAPIRLWHAASLMILQDKGHYVYQGMDNGSGLQTWLHPTVSERDNPELAIVRLWFPRKPSERR